MFIKAETRRTKGACGDRHCRAGSCVGEGGFSRGSRRDTGLPWLKTGRRLSLVPLPRRNGSIFPASFIAFSDDWSPCQLGEHLRKRWGLYAYQLSTHPFGPKRVVTISFGAVMASFYAIFSRAFGFFLRRAYSSMRYRCGHGLKRPCPEEHQTGARTFSRCS